MEKQAESCTFSIIVPVYQVEKYLDACVQSVLQQTNTSWEMLLIDDGSHDTSGALCDAWAKRDARIRVIHQQNQGLGGARNTGMRAARGTWLLFLDSDDQLAPQALCAWERAICAYPEVNVLVARYAGLGEDGMTYPIAQRKPFAAGVCDSQPLREAVLRYRDTAGWAVWKLAVRRSILVQDQLYFLPHIRVAEDLYWILRLFLAVPALAFADEMVYFYRENRGGNLNANLAGRIEGAAQASLALQREFGATACTENQRFALSYLGDVLLSELLTVAALPQEQQKTYLPLLQTHQKLLRFVQRGDTSLKRYLLAQLAARMAPTRVCVVLTRLNTRKTS